MGLRLFAVEIKKISCEPNVTVTCRPLALPPHAPSTQRYNIAATWRGERWASWATPTQVGFEPCGRQALGNLGNRKQIAQNAQNHQADGRWAIWA
jgi:hypothetical protein